MIKNQIIKSIQKVVGKENVHLEVPENEEFGDYSSNIAMQMFSRAGERETRLPAPERSDGGQGRRAGAKSPRSLSEEIVQRLSKDKVLSETISDIKVDGPGFINFWLKKEYLVNQVNRVNQEGEGFGAYDLGKGKTVVIDYSAPNIAKKFSVGHLRSTIIGQALYNLYKNLGYKVIGDNHLGDWGTQFGMIIAQVIRKKVDVSKLSIEEIEKLYVDFNKEAKGSPKLKKEGSAWFKKLEDGDPQARKIWQECIDISMKEFGKIWDMLDVSIDYAYGESFYEGKMGAVIDEFRKKKVSKKSKGAEIVEFEKMAPAILLKSDGGTTYFTRDLATIRYRLDTWNPNLIIYEVGVEQALHFKQVFAAAKKIGWIKEKDVNFMHVAHGLFLLNGKKMSTRKGTTVKLEDVLDGAIEKAYRLVSESETGKKLERREKREIAKSVGIGAVKYFDLMHHPTSEINFNWKSIFNMEGNSGPYLQYTYARTQSVLRKSRRTGEQERGNNSHSEFSSESDLNQILKPACRQVKQVEDDKKGKSHQSSVISHQLNAEELFLLRSFIHFLEVIQTAAENYAPNLICNYLYDLAQKFNLFYSKHRILEDVNSGQWVVGGEKKSKKEKSPNTKHHTPNTSFRLALTAATGQILKNGLKLLGIKTLGKM